MLKTIDLETLELARQARAAQFTVAPRITRYLDAAGKASSEGNHAEAKALLERLDMRTLNPYERALVYRLKAFVAYGAGEYAVMIDYLEKVLAEQVLPLEQENRVRFNIAQVYGSTQQWDKVVAALKEWFRYVKDPNPVSYYLLGIAYFQLEKLDLAIENTKKAM